MQNGSIAVKVNNYSEYISTVSNTTPGWDVPPTNEMSTYIYMDKGKNTIKITPMGSGGPNMDKFEIITTDVELPKPGGVSYRSQRPKPLNYSKPRNLKPTVLTRCRSIRGKYIGDFDLAANSYLRFNNVEIPEAGTYELKVYSMGSSRALTIKVNTIKKVSFVRKTPPTGTMPLPQWALPMIYLDKGTNTLTFGLHTRTMAPISINSRYVQRPKK